MKFCPNCSTLLKIVDNISDLPTQLGGGDYKEFIDTILNSDKIDTKINIANISRITQSHDYKILSIENQEIVYNKIQELLPKDKKKLNENKSPQIEKKPVYYICPDCSFYKKLQPNTLIYSETKNKQDKNINDFSHMINNPILPRTTEYTCVNDKCDTHKTGGVAVYMRHNNKIIYICETCKYQWT